MAGPKLGASFYCGICSKKFHQKNSLMQHLQNHPDSTTAWSCEVCQWLFDDQLALEKHQINAGHGKTPVKGSCEAPQFWCDNPNCLKDGGPFPTQTALNRHKKFPSNCSDAFTQKKPRQADDQLSLLCGAFPVRDKVDHLPPPIEPPPSSTVTVSTLRASLGPQSTEPDEGKYCHVCKKTFNSPGQFNNHFLRCEPPRRSETSEQPVINAPSPTTSVPASFASKTKSNDTARSGGLKVPIPSSVTKLRNGSTSSLSPSSSPQPREAVAPKDIMPLHQPAQQQKTIAEASKRLPVGPVMAPVQPVPSTRPSTNLTNGSTTSRAPSVPIQTSSDSTPFGSFKCSATGCDRVFQAEAALKLHQADAHGMGGRSFDLHGEHSFMLNQRVRDQLAQSGLLRSQTQRHSTPSRLRRGASGMTQRGSRDALHYANHQIQPPSFAMPPLLTQIPNNASVGGPEEMQQAHEIYGKILRLGLQLDVLIHHTGKMTCSGIDWIRIGVAKQPNVVHMFDELCHLPKVLQSQEYLPPSKAFKDEYKSQYAISEFRNTHDPSPSKQSVAVLALSCIKVLMADGTHEVVKIAAIDVLNGRILMNNLVCSHPTRHVQDWRTNITGLTSYKDMEAARQDGYKVFKGWKAARAALWKFIDKETIIVGHNLRSDLDALRMIHGRAVDVAKLIEKAANGPLSKQQLSLETLCRDLTMIHLSSHPSFGRDTLQNAFAARELALWKIKNEDKWSKWAKQKSIDFQRITPAARA